MKRGTAASLRWSNLFPKVYKLTHDFGRRGVDAFWELALEPFYPHPVCRARPARSSPVLRAQTQSPGLPGPGGGRGSCTRGLPHTWHPRWGSGS